MSGPTARLDFDRYFSRMAGLNRLKLCDECSLLSSQRQQDRSSTPLSLTRSARLISRQALTPASSALCLVSPSCFASWGWLQLVGRTAFGIHPREIVRTIPKVGGTKNLQLDKARAVRPTHAIVNVEENTKEDAAALAELSRTSLSLTPEHRAITLGCIAPSAIRPQ